LIKKFRLSNSFIFAYFAEIVAGLTTSFLPDRIYKLLFALLGLVYVIGLFIPLMDNDSAHHANIALHMHLTGNYVDLVDYSQAYLDKPHLHFWLAALSYKLFGVTSFAYKFPSFLFTILGTYSVYRLGKALYDREVGKLAALMIASAFAYILANNDVRMDALLTAFIAFATWQLVEFIDRKKIIHVAGAALGLALGFCTKGHLGVFVPVVASFFYILYRRDWRLFYNWKWLLLLVLFAIFIAPVVYCYWLQFNLHPEIIVRGKDHLNGVLFILFNQSVERFGGEMGDFLKNDHLFFFHSFTWAFAPWSLLAFIAFVTRLKTFSRRREEWLTTGLFGVMMVMISFSDFKLPHYLNVIFPAVSVMTASFVLSKKENRKWVRALFIIQITVSLLLLLLAGLVNVWMFPVTRIWIITGFIFLLALVFYFFKSELYNRAQKAIAVSVSSMIALFFLLNTNFYPQLLTYQGGNELALKTRNKVNREDIYFEKNSYSPSFNFYSSILRKPFTDSVLVPGKSIWVFADGSFVDTLKQGGYRFGKIYDARRHRITILTGRFLNPATREKELSKMYLVEVLGKN
jgi:4-amino-4-deoxy-L-arabinose transferase-like glycosyltransferase